MYNGNNYTKWFSTRESPKENKYQKYIIEGVAWFGSALILTAYIGSLERTTDFLFNTLGAAGVLVVSDIDRILR